MGYPLAADHAPVFRHFAVPPDGADERSRHRYSPVFAAVVAGRRAVLKRTLRPLTRGRGVVAWADALARCGIPVVTPLPTPMANPATVGTDVWVAYPWVDGTAYTGTAAEIAAAGELLGRLHAAPAAADGLQPFEWPEHDAASVREDVDGLRRVLDRHAPELAGPVVGRLAPLLASFMTTTLPAIRSAGLPHTGVCLDYKANNLVYTPAGPVLIDPDNAEYAPRLLDLALAVLLFHTDAPTAPGRLFTPAQWRLFRDGYLRRVEPTPAERAAWPDALRYMLLEWGVWAAIDAGEWDGDWQDPRQRSFLLSLLQVEMDDFPLV